MSGSDEENPLAFNSGSHAISNGLLGISELTPRSARLANGKLIQHNFIFL